MQMTNASPRIAAVIRHAIDGLETVLRYPEFLQLLLTIIILNAFHAKL